MVNGFRCCKVVLTITTERGDAIIEVSSNKIVGSMTIGYDDIIPKTVAVAININELSI